MKRIHIKRPDIKGGIQRVKNLKPEDIKKYWKKRKERREQIFACISCTFGMLFEPGH